MENTKETKWVRVKEYAKIHGYHEASVRHFVMDGKLEYHIIDGEKYLDADIKPHSCYKSYPYFNGRKSHTRIYRIWQNMKRRCIDTKYRSYRYYGERGIKVCDEWLNSSDAFIEWAYNNGYADDLEIDRIDGGGNYEPSNCRWVTHEENNKNRDFNRWKNTYSYKKHREEAEMKKLRNEFGFMGEKWLEEMDGFIRKNLGLDK